jgi:hypothetical protein
VGDPVSYPLVCPNGHLIPDSVVGDPCPVCGLPLGPRTYRANVAYPSSGPSTDGTRITRDIGDL